jgi:DNA-binding transcriptional ArsR family regulator
MKNVNYLEKSIYNQYTEINKIEELFLFISTIKLTKKKKEILRWLVENYHQKTVYTTLIQKISEELEIPKSTVRWNLKGLREADLIRAGDKNNKGIPVSLTHIGRIVADYTIMSD